MCLIREYDRVFGAGSKKSLVEKPEPTSESLARICWGLKMPGLPSTLIQMAREAIFYSQWFTRLGPDYGSSTHILQINRYWRNHGLPSRFIVFTYGLDAVCDCLDRESSGDPESMRVVQIQLPDEIYEGYVEFAPNFELYLERLVDIFSQD